LIAGTWEKSQVSFFLPEDKPYFYNVPKKGKGLDQQSGRLDSTLRVYFF